MRIRRQRHDDAHYPLQGRGARAWRGGSGVASSVQVVMHKAESIPQSPWQRMLQAARFKQDVFLMFGFDRKAARQHAVDDLAEMRQQERNRIKFS